MRRFEPPTVGQGQKIAIDFARAVQDGLVPDVPTLDAPGIREALIDRFVALGFFYDDAPRRLEWARGYLDIEAAGGRRVRRPPHLPTLRARRAEILRRAHWGS